MLKIYCIEDNLLYGKMLKHKLSLDPEFDVHLFPNGEAFLSAIHEAPDIVTLDLLLPDCDGLELMKRIKKELSATEVIVLSGQNSIEIATEIFRLEAYDYIYKDESALERLWKVIHNLAATINLKKEVVHLQSEVSSKYDLKTDIQGTSEGLQDVFNKVQKCLDNTINVIVTGETGTGKDLVAKTIHYNSKRASKPFIAINVASIPNELIESELFGHEKGAFTGAISRRIGLLEAARGGTLFLDEIGEMELTMQAKLLRVLQEMKLSRIGSGELIDLDFRLIIATHRNLLNEVSKGRFREDLYYRMMGITIELPPLRTRGKDILVLANYFLEQFSIQNNYPLKKLTTTASKSLLKYDFPGNVRELKAMIDTAAVMSDSELIDVDDLSFREPTRPENDLNSMGTLESLTNKIIENRLRYYKFNVIKAAASLDIGKSTLYRLIQEGKITKE